MTKLEELVAKALGIPEVSLPPGKEDELLRDASLFDPYQAATSRYLTHQWQKIQDIELDLRALVSETLNVELRDRMEELAERLWRLNEDPRMVVLRCGHQAGKSGMVTDKTWKTQVEESIKKWSTDPPALFVPWTKIASLEKIGVSKEAVALSMGVDFAAPESTDVAFEQLLNNQCMRCGEAPITTLHRCTHTPRREDVVWMSQEAWDELVAFSWDEGENE